MTPSIRLDPHGLGRSRIAGWSAAACVLLLPALAIQWTEAVAWGPEDFLVAGALIGGAGPALEWAVRTRYGPSYRSAMAVALAAGLALIWGNLAVGFIGDEGNPANAIFAGVLAVAGGGALLARLRPLGLARAMAATAAAQALAGAIAAALDPRTLALSASFTAAWLVAAGLFRRATRAESLAQP